ncbi:MAG: transposase [Gallionella sp.]|nr:transposase [Gallionella sp.]
MPKFITSDSLPDTPVFDPDIHHRRSIRLRSYDYSQAGAYFITLCTQKRECLFGAVVDDGMRLNDVGRMVQNVLGALPDHYSCVGLDSFVVMPNHIHGIIMLHDVGAQFIVPNNDQGAANPGAMNRAPTIGGIIRAFKACCTHGINQLRSVQGVSLWQRNYYEHVIRNEPSLQEIREYIANNPAQWAIDRENPDVVGAQFIVPNNDQGAANPGAMNRAPTDGKR